MTNTPISIVIPTFTAVEYLKICLESIVQNQHNKENEVVVVVDGTYNINKNVLESYKNHLNLKIIVFDENKGLALATNYGFYNCSNQHVLYINDDNVCPKDFDLILNITYESTIDLGEIPEEIVTVLTPNQIEPVPSIFKPFIIKDFGDIGTFNLNDFTEEELKIRELPFNYSQNGYGWTLPFFMKKEHFIALGGFDVCYDSPHVIDWDFFIKLEKIDGFSYRTNNCNFYHFGSKSARTPESYQKEREAHEYFRYKWGFSAYNRLLM
jgi:glycosyltransferase involved in cell wall biosynthesis